MTTLPRSIAALDVPLADVEQELAAEVLIRARAASPSPSDRIAYANDLYLLAHPEVCAVDADYPGFAAWIADQVAKNRTVRRTS
ncbi:hypothetical protein ACFYPA_06525 [Streptomyces sp. NPDC005775]|uniref:hypothetical protein n=1 Tax=Streptomyces sp. NPDC005775 TaxID=3364729 RepID=UPI00367E439C